MNKPDLMYLMEFFDEVEAVIEADIDQITWGLWEQLINARQIVKDELDKREIK